ncbi:MAG: peptidoglycan-binding domain-containing protein, partial [Hyphomicrobiaceae bacterium]
MRMLFKFACGFIALSLLSIGTAFAQECKSDAVTATSREYISKSLGAYPGSWAAWRKAVKSEHGDGWQAWRRAKEQEIKCDQVTNDSGRKRWVCTRTGVPCRPGSGDPSPCDGPEITRNLRKGDSGEQVKTLQCLLKSYHGADVAVDGDFGNGTRAAVRSFQRKNGLTADGVV